MASTHSKPHVLIIGGGLGGPALAQALRKRGISFELFERDDSRMSRSQGWAVLLHDDMIRDFKTNLPDDLPDLATVDQLYEHGIPSELAIYNIDEQLKTVWRKKSTEEEPMIRASRARLRNYLMRGINAHWDKKFESYKQDENGVTAYFQDGTSYHGDILVGADGVHSHVRAQLFAEPKPHPVAMGVMIGEFTATRKQWEEWIKLGSSLFVGFASGGRRVTIAMKSISADKESAEYYWIYGWQDPRAVDEDHWTAKATREELHEFVNSNLDGFQETFADILKATPVEGIYWPCLRVRDMVPPEQMPRGRVTLIGDAVHPMTPFQGQGANTAMTDGLSLASLLDSKKGEPIEDILKAYEAEMQPRGKKMVLASRYAWTQEVDGYENGVVHQKSPEEMQRARIAS